MGVASLAGSLFNVYWLGGFLFIIISREWSRQLFVFMIESACAGYMEEDVLDGMPSLDSSGDGFGVPSLQK